MIFSRVILLFFIFDIRAIKSSSLVVGNRAELEVENLLTEFMSDLKKSSFEKLHRHRLIVLGKMANFLQTTKVLLEIGMPCVIRNKAEANVFPSHFGAESNVLFFIDGFSDSEMNMTFGKLPKDCTCKTMIISTDKTTTDRSITSIISSAVKTKLTNVLFAHFDGQEIRIYGRNVTANCGPEITLVNGWIPRRGFRINEKVLGLDDARPRKHGCPMFVSTFESPPMMMLQEDANGTLHIRGGLEGYLVKTIAEYLHMVPVVKVPSMKDQFWIEPNGTILGIIGDVAKGVASLGIGQLRPTLERANMIDFTASYFHECTIWTVPLKLRYNYNIIVSEFSLSTWIVVILSVSLCCGLAHVIPKLKMGHESPVNIFDVIAMTLNYAIPRQPSGVLCKSLFLLYLHYSRVLTTAYSTSLSSILTTTTAEPAIVDEVGILAAGLRTAGGQSSLSLLTDQISPNSTRAELVRRFEIITPFETALARIADRKDIAYLRHLSTINHVRNALLIAKKPLRFYPLPKCVISYSSVMAVPKGSSLTRKINNIITRLREAGFYEYWMNLEIPYKSPIKISESNHHTLVRLQSVFFLYLCCLIPAFLAFIVELIVFKLQFGWFTR